MPSGAPAKAAKIKVLVADASVLVTEALAVALETFPGLTVAEARPRSGPEAVAAAAESPPDVALIDYWLPEMEGPAVVRRILAEAPVAVLVTSWAHGPGQIEAALAAGAAGFLPKSVTLEGLVDAVRRAHAGERPVLAEEIRGLQRKLEQRIDRERDAWARLLTLSEREIRVLRVLAFGRPVEEVAKALSLSKATVRGHIHSILEKTGTRSQVEALAMARHHGLIQT